MKKDKLLFVLMKHKLLSILLTVLVGLGYSVECSAQQTGYFKSPLRSGMYVTIMNDTLHLETDATKKIAWTVGTFDSYASSISYDGKYITNGEHNFVLGDSKTALYFVDTETNQLVNTLVNDKSYYILYKSGTDLYLIRNYKNTSGYYGYFELKKFDSTSNINYNGDYAANSSTMDADFKVKIASNRFNNCAFVFEKAELPSVKYGKIALGSFEDASGTASIEDVTLNTAFNSGTECIGAATKELTLTASAKEGYTFKGWKLNGELIEGSATSPFIYTYSYSSESTDPTADVLTPVFKEVGKLTECYITYAGNSGTYYISMASASSLQRASDKQIWTFGDADENGMISLSTEYNNNNYYLTRKSGSGSSSFAPTTEETSLYFFDASNGKLVSELTLGNSYFIVAKSSSSYYVMRYSSSSGLTALEATTSSSSYKLSDKNFNSSTTLTISSSYKSSCTFSLAAPPKPSIKYGKVSLAASVSNGTYSITSGTTDGALITSTACIGAASKDIVLAAEASTNYVFMGWSVNGGTTILEGSNVSSYTYSFSFDSEDNATPTEVTLTPVFEKLPELSGTKCFLMNGDNYIGYASGAFTLSTTNKQEWAFGTTSDFVTPFSTLVNNQINYLGYKYTSDTDALSLLADDNNTIYFFDTATNKAATSLEVGKSYYIVVSSTSGTSNKSKYLIRVSGSKLVASKQSSSSKSDDFTLSSLNISELVTIDVDSSVKTASTFTLASTTPAVSSVKYGKVTLATVENGTYSITDGTTSGELITSDAVAGAASKDIVFEATANESYVFMGWSVDGGTTILEGSNVSPYTYSFSFDSEDNATPTEVTLTPVFEKLPELSGTKCFLMNGDNYIGYADGVFTSSTTDKQEWAFGTTSDFVTPFSTLVNNQINYLGYPASVSGSTTVFADVNSSDNSSVYFFDATTNKPASSLEAGKSYYIVIKSTRSESASRYVVSYSDGTLKTTKASTSSGSYIISNTTISADVTLTLDNSVKAACTFTLASTAPATPSVKYGKVTLATVENGTYSITDGTTSGDLITSDAVAGAASKDIVLEATASKGYEFMGWSVNGGTTILEGSNVSPYTYSFSFDSEDNATPTEVTLTPVFMDSVSIYGAPYYIKNVQTDTYFNSSSSQSTLSDTPQTFNVKALDDAGLYRVYFTTGGTNYSIDYEKREFAPSDKLATSTEFTDNIYFYEIADINAVDNYTATKATTIATGKNYFILGTSSSTGNNTYIMMNTPYNNDNTKSLGSYKVTVSENTISVPKLQGDSCVYTLATENTPEPQPTTATYYGKLTVSGSNGTIFASTEDEAIGGDSYVDVNETVDLPAENATKTIYLYATPDENYDFLGWSTSTSENDTIEGSKVAKFAYTFEFDGTELQPTDTTLYAIFKMQEQPQPQTKTLYGKLTVSGSNGTVYIATESGAVDGETTVTVSDDNVASDATSATKTLYLYASANEGYDFLGWSTSESEDNLIASSNVVEFAYSFTFSSETENPEATTLFALFKRQEQPNPGELLPRTDISVFDNVLYLNDEEITTGTQFDIELNMKNADENIRAFQCDIYLPEGIDWTTMKNSRQEVILTLPKFNEERTDEYYHNVQVSKIPEKDNCYRIIVYSDKNYTILKQDGAILSLPLTVAENMKGGDYNILLKDIIMTTVKTEQESTVIEQDSIGCIVSMLTVNDYTIGDVNNDHSINVTDIVAIVSYLMGQNPQPFIIKAADAFSDGSINVTDIVKIIDIINSAPAKVAEAKAFGARKSVVESDNALEVVAEGNAVTLNMTNKDEITAFQCDVYLSEGIEWASALNRSGNISYELPTFAGRTDVNSHSISLTRLEDGGFRIIVYSINNDAFAGNEGAVLNLPLNFNNSGSYSISLENITLTTTDVKGMAANNSKTIVNADATGMNGIMNAGKADGKIFDLNGIRSNKAKHGFNIINNKKMWIE